MIDSSICAEAVTSWGAMIWRVLRWLLSPAKVISVLMVAIALVWLVRSIRRKWVWSGCGVLLLAAYLLLISPLGVNASSQLLVNLLPQDSGDRADAIVVLGRGDGMRPQRVQVAADLWKADRAPIVFASGRRDALEIAQGLEAQNVPGSAIDGESCSRTTEENALFTSLLLKPRQMQRIVLVTDPPHMLRSLLTFRSLGFEVIPHPNPLPPDFGTRQQASLVFREYFSLMGYGALGRFWRRDVPPGTTVAVERAIEVATVEPRSPAQL